MTDRERLTLEYPEKMCDYCCNFDREHVGMDGTALCKLTMTLAYAEDYGGNCMFYNVPKERIIVPPCKVRTEIFGLFDNDDEQRKEIYEGNILCYSLDENNLLWATMRYKNGLSYWHTIDDFGKTVFLTKEEAENALKEREAGAV